MVDESFDEFFFEQLYGIMDDTASIGVYVGSGVQGKTSTFVTFVSGLHMLYSYQFWTIKPPERSVRKAEQQGK